MSTRDGPVAACVKTALERYLRQLDGEKTTDLYDMVLEQVEKPLLEIIMTHTQSNQCKAADMLGINRNTLRKKLQLYGLSKHRSSTKRATRRK